MPRLWRLLLLVVAATAPMGVWGKCKCVDCRATCDRNGGGDQTVAACAFNVMSLRPLPRTCGYGRLTTCEWGFAHDTCKGDSCPHHPDWMSTKLADDTLLKMVSLPGTHDSATSTVFGVRRPFENIAACQTWSIPTQLDNGIRYFDIRIGKNKQLVHGPIPTEVTLAQALHMFRDFIGKHKREFLLVRFKLEGNGLEGIDGWENDVKQAGFTRAPAGEKLGELRVSELRGKLLWLDMVDYTAQTQDEWQVGWRPADKKQHVTTQFTKANTGQLSFNHISGATKGAEVAIPILVAKDLNAFVLEQLPEYERVGVVIFDFPSHQLVESVISCNEK